MSWSETHCSRSLSGAHYSKCWSGAHYLKSWSRPLYTKSLSGANYSASCSGDHYSRVESPSWLAGFNTLASDLVFTTQNLGLGIITQVCASSLGFIVKNLGTQFQVLAC